LSPLQIFVLLGVYVHGWDEKSPITPLPLLLRTATGTHRRLQLRVETDSWAVVTRQTRLDLQVNLVVFWVRPTSWNNTAAAAAFPTLRK